MNRFVSVGLSVALAPAVLLAYGNWMQSPDTITVSEWALFNVALPLGGLLVVYGLWAMADGKIETASFPWYPKAKEVVSRILIEVLLWTLSAVIAFPVVTAIIETRAHNPGDQPFLDAIIRLQTFIVAALIRLVIALSKQELKVWRVVKICLIILLVVVFSGVSMCSDMFLVPHWGPGG